MSDDAGPSKLERMVDSAQAKFVRTFVMPILMGLLVWLGNKLWDKLDENNATTTAGIKELHDGMAEIRQSVAVQSAVFGDKTKQIDDNATDNKRQDLLLSNHEARIQVLESDKGIRR